MKNYNEIVNILKQYEIEEYAIHVDGTVDVYGDVIFDGQQIIELPVSFGNVTEDFSCFGCTQLASLDGMPYHVGNDLDLRSTRIISMRDFNFRVDGRMYCDWHKVINGGISLCQFVKTSLQWSSGPFEIIEKYIGRPEDIFECQAELIYAGFEEYAQL